MLRMLVVFLLAISITRFALSSALHVATFLSTSLGGICRFFWFHAGVFVVAIPTIFIYRYEG